MLLSLEDNIISVMISVLCTCLILSFGVGGYKSEELVAAVAVRSICSHYFLHCN